MKLKTSTAFTDQLIISNKNQVEIFKELRQIGPYKIPDEIEFGESGQPEFFAVRKVEFLTQPTAERFDLVRQKHFGHDQKLMKIDLGEPPW
jgi:hypothetical protein